ncbi:hypothetical protein CR513_41765, partial [Mucuna pruriens]
KKAQSMLNHFIMMKAKEKKKSKEQHLFLALEYHDRPLRGRQAERRILDVAKKHPRVHELFVKPLEHCTCYNIYKCIIPSYYSYCDNEDDVLEDLEGLTKNAMWWATAKE